MSKVRAHRHVASVKLAALGGLIASLTASAIGCSARATGEEDIVAISHDKTSSSHPRSGSSSTNETLSTVNGSADPFLEPSDRSAAGSGGGGGPSKAADAGSSTPDATHEAEKGPLAYPTLGGARDVPRQTVLFWVDAVGSRVWRANAEGDGSDRQLLAGALTIASPDGITVDLTDNFIYWTNMGSPVGGAAGSLQRMKIDAEVVETVIPVGTTSTPKQISLDNQARKLYWSDREAMVWRSELDGSDPEVILSGHQLMQPAGLGLDVAKRQVYISDRYGRRLYRVGFDMPEGETAENRSDVELLAEFTTTAWPLNISLDLETRRMYWTDRSRGVIYSMNMDMPAGANPLDRTDMTTVVAGLTEPVGIAYDELTKRLYFTELSGRVSRCNLNDCKPEVILTTASASGIALAHLPE
jgi:DNA-binding beta-propeller fold protein YncE